MTQTSLASTGQLGAAPSAPAAAPYDFAACADRSDWRDNVAWPVSHAEQFDLGRRSSRALLAWLRDETDESRRNVVLLAGPTVLNFALAFAERALAVRKADDMGLSFVGAAPELDYFRRREPNAPIPALDLRFGPPVLARPRHAMLRRIARTASWSSLPALPLSLLAPEAVAVSHNALLRDCARHGGARVGYAHAENMHREIRGHAVSLPAPPAAAHLCSEITALLVGASGLGGHFARRLQALLQHVGRPFFDDAARDLQAAQGSPRIPARIWAGSGGYWPTRCISIEALRRGGEVRRFEHGGQAGMIEVVEPIAISELSVSSEFTCATPAMAERLERTEARDLVGPYRAPRITGWRGEPNITRIALDRAHALSARRRVLYGPSILLGPRQLFPPLLPDPVHLDWQFRLVEALKRLPIDLVCRPHPEGLLYKRRHPLADLIDVSPHPYEALLPDADVLVFDYGQSTTFYEALCSDRPVVLIDLGNPLFTPAVRAAVERRCRLIRARFDDRNRPQIDAAELAEAVCGGSDAADPSEFRSLLLGQA